MAASSAVHTLGRMTSPATIRNTKMWRNLMDLRKFCRKLPREPTMDLKNSANSALSIIRTNTHPAITAKAGVALNTNLPAADAMYMDTAVHTTRKTRYGVRFLGILTAA